MKRAYFLTGAPSTAVATRLRRVRARKGFSFVTARQRFAIEAETQRD